MDWFDSHELAWASGFFEGEGSISLARSPRHSAFAIHLSAHQVDREPLDRFCRVVAGIGTVRGPYREREGRSIYQWTCTRWSDGQAVVAMLWPRLSQRRRNQWHVVLAAYKAAPIRRHLTPHDVREIRARYRRGEYGHRRLSRDFGVSTRCIADVVTGKTWTGIT